jgi:5-oxoprolinase (ATP-hydrolysing) subunit A
VSAPSTTLRFAPYGDRALLAPIDHVAPAARGALLNHMRGLPRVLDAYLTAKHALVLAGDVESARALPREWEVPGDVAPAELQTQVSQHTVALVWDGPDLDEAAARVGLTRDALARALMAPTYTASFLGLRPGFAYLEGVPPALRLPRRDHVRPRVPANTFALGGPYAGVYPCASPGGFWLLGTAVGLTLFEREGSRAGPLLRVGDEVRFVEAPP